ncbi:hypothetical protein FDECE_561 [Fusarium decemcellulare]|nr:hypothetical protein FDECE_561 [Fusarium decemcellulare]
MVSQFPFYRLPAELRLRIWEETWPAPRLFRRTHFISSSPRPPVKLAPIGDVAWWLQQDERTRWSSMVQLLTGQLPNRRVNPSTIPPTNLPPERTQLIALYICSESRRHMLKSYRRMQNYSDPRQGFYMSPARDMLCLDTFLDNQESPRDELWNAYGKQLKWFTKAMVHVTFFHDPSDMKIMQVLGGMEIIYTDFVRNETALDYNALLRSLVQGTGGEPSYHSDMIFRMLNKNNKICAEVDVRMSRC